MTERDFCYWLNGFLELSEENRGLSPAQLELVRRHLSLVFEKKTPALADLKENLREAARRDTYRLDLPYCGTTVMTCSMDPGQEDKHPAVRTGSASVRTIDPPLVMWGDGENPPASC